MRRAIATATFGPHYSIGYVTLPTFRNYARKIGAELFVYQGSMLQKRLPTPNWAKLFMADLFAQGFDEVAWIDSDAIISPTAGNLFDEAKGKFAAFPESSKLDRIGNFKRYLKLVHDEVSVDPKMYFNTGVMVIPKSARIIVDRPPEDKLELTLKLRRERPDRFFHDQDWINSVVLLNGLETRCLPLSYNFMPFEDVWDRRHKANIVHYAGRWNIHGRDLLEMIKADLAKWR